MKALEKKFRFKICRNIDINATENFY